MEVSERLQEIQGLRFRFQMNNRLRLEALAALSKVFREFGEPISDELLSSFVFALPQELIASNDRGWSIRAAGLPPEPPSPGPGLPPEPPGPGLPPEPPGPGLPPEPPGPGLPPEPPYPGPGLPPEPPGPGLPPQSPPPGPGLPPKAPVRDPGRAASGSPQVAL